MILASLTNIFIISLCVLFHYDMLTRISQALPRMRVAPRFRVLLGVLAALVAHVVEIWIFAFGYYVMIHTELYGDLVGDVSHSLLDYAYYSFVTYTSLGFGDVLPTGHLRFLTGLEALTGLVLIAWTASFLYVEMQKYWKH